MAITYDDMLATAAKGAEWLKHQGAVIDNGITGNTWSWFEEPLKKLAVRDKLKPAHWQRLLHDPFVLVGLAKCPDSFIPRQARDIERDPFVTPEEAAVVTRAIDEMCAGSRPWCNPQIFDEPQARKALRKALDTILEATSAGSGGGPRVAVPQ